jgi:hypothetical protein
MLMLGREIGLAAELMFGSPGKTGQPEGDQYVGELQTAIEGPTGWLGRLSNSHKNERREITRSR